MSGSQVSGCQTSERTAGDRVEVAMSKQWAGVGRRGADRSGSAPAAERSPFILVLPCRGGCVMRSFPSLKVTLMDTKTSKPDHHAYRQRRDRARHAKFSFSLWIHNNTCVSLCVALDLSTLPSYISLFPTEDDRIWRWTEVATTADGIALQSRHHLCV